MRKAGERGVVGDISRQIGIERMAEADVPEVHALERICFAAPWDIAAYYRELANPYSYYLVARTEGQIIGFGGMWVSEDEAHVVTLCVRPGYRRRGSARRLMEVLLQEARRRKAPLVTLEVRVSNGAAQRLYTALGFRIISHRRYYYPDNAEDAAVMALRLREEQPRRTSAAPHPGESG